MRRHRTSFPTILVAFLIAAAPLGAQVSDSIPRELALALLGGLGRTGAAAIVVGSAPDGFPISLVPPGATVLGGRAQNSQSTAVLAMAQPEDEARRILEERLNANGFSVFNGHEAPRRGFVSAEFGGTTSSGNYCRGDEGMTMTVRRRERGGSIALLFRTDPQSRSGICRSRDQIARSANYFELLPVPALTPQDGFRSEQAGSGGGGDSWSLTARLFGNGSSEAVVRHYTAQLVADGWVATERTHASGVALQLLRRENAGKLEWSAVLLAVSPMAAQAPMDVTLNLRKH